MYCKNCGKEVKDNEICDCLNEKLKGQEENNINPKIYKRLKDYGSKKGLYILRLVFCCFGLITGAIFAINSWIYFHYFLLEKDEAIFDCADGIMVFGMGIFLILYSGIHLCCVLELLEDE